MKSSSKRSVVRLVGFLAVVVVLAVLIVPSLTEDALTTGLKAYEDGEYTRAARLLERAVARKSVDIEVLKKLGRAHEIMGNYSASAQVYRQAMERRPGDLDLIRACGEALIQSGKKENPPLQAAETFARQWIQNPEHPASTAGYYLLGKTLFRRYVIQREAFINRTVASFKGPNVWQVIGVIRHALNAKKFFGAARSEMVRQLESLVKLSPSDPLYESVNSLRRTQEAALDALHEARKRPGHEGYPVLTEAEMLLDLEHYDQAEATARSLLDGHDRAVNDGVKIETQRILAKILESLPEATDARLREAANYWGAFLYGLESLPRTYRQKSLLLFEAHNARGQLFVRMKSPHDLQEVAESLLANDPNDSYGLFYRGMAAYFRGDYKTAEMDLNASLNKRHDFMVFMTLGRILAHRGTNRHHELARQYFRSAARFAPLSAEPLLEEARLYASETPPNYRDAYETIRKTLSGKFQLEKNSEEIEHLRDEVELGLLKSNPAENYATLPEAHAALEANKRNLYALYVLADGYLKQGDLAQSLDYSERLDKMAHKNMLAKLLHARVLLQTGVPARLAEAERILREAQDLDRYDDRPIALAAQVARGLNHGLDHWNLLNKVVKVAPHNVKARTELAQLLYQAKQFEAARFHLDIALGQLTNPTYDIRHLDLRLKLALNDLQAAEADLAELEGGSFRIPPGDLAYLYGVLRERQGKIPQAIEWYTRGILEAPRRSDVVCAAARLEIDQGDEDTAFKRLCAFRNQGGRNIEVNALLGKLLLERWDLTEAVKVFGEMRQLDWGDRRGQWGFGISTLYLGRHDRLSEGLNALRYYATLLSRDKERLAKETDTIRSVIFGYLVLKQWPAAVENLQRFDILTHGTPPRRRALLAYFNGDFRAAAELIQKGLAAEPSDPFLRFLRGLLNLRDDRLDGVLEDVCALVPGIAVTPPWQDFAEKVARERPGFGRLILAAVARVHLLRDHLEAAAQILDRGARAFPEDAQIRYLNAHLMFRRGQRDHALTQLRKIESEIGPKAIRDQAVILVLDRKSQAVQLMQRYAAARPREGEKLLAWVRFETGFDHYTEVLKTLRGNPSWRWKISDRVFLTGLAFIVDGPEGAFGQLPGPETLLGPYLKTLLLNAPSGQAAMRYVTMWRNLIKSMALFDLPLFRNQAALFLDDVLAADPEHPLFLFLVARLQNRAHDAASARESIERITTPEHDALKLFELAHIDSRQPETRNRALEYLRKVTALKPRSGTVRIALARLLLDMNHGDEAVQVLQKGLDLGVDRTNPELQALLGQAFEKVGDPIGAISAYARALHLDPRNHYVAYRMTRQFLASHRLAEALTLLARYPELRSSFPDLQLLLGLACHRFHRDKEARSILSGFPYSAQAALILGHIAREEGKKQEALQHYEYAFGLDPDQQRDALLHAVEVYRQDYDFWNALETVNRFVSWYPLDPRGRKIQAELMESLFRPEQESLEKWLEAWLVDRKDPLPVLKMASLMRRKGDYKAARTLLDILEHWPTPLSDTIARELKRERMFLTK